MTLRYGVLGAGALGLTSALRLAQRGHSVTVFERESLPGGLAAGFRPDPASDVWLEKFYHHLFRSDRAAAKLIDELGLGADLEWHRPRTVTLLDGSVHQLDSAGSLLRFTPLPLVDRVRMGAALAYLRLVTSPIRLEGRTAADWIRRVMGERAYRVVWAPLLAGKFGAAAEEIAMPWFWARVHDRTAELGYLRGGFQRLYDRLAAEITRLGGSVHLGAPVTGIEPVKAGIAVMADGPETDGRYRFDRVVSTLPTRVTCMLTPALPGWYRDRYAWGRAYGAHCMIVALDRPLAEAYWMNINDPGFPFMALVEHTNMRSPSEYGGRHLVYLGNYRPMDDPLFTASPADVLEQFVPHLARINAGFQPSWVTGTWVFSAPYAQPIVSTDYKAHIPPFETPIPGLFVANMFQVYPHDRGQNYSIELAERLVEHLDARPRSTRG